MCYQLFCVDALLNLVPIEFDILLIFSGGLSYFYSLFGLLICLNISLASCPVRNENSMDGSDVILTLQYLHFSILKI